MREMNQWTIAVFVLAVAWGVWATLPARAQEAAEEEKARKIEAQQDRREKVTEMREQLRRGTELSFDQADTNADGFLDRQEAVDAYDWAAGVFAAMDADGDKKISRGEFAQWGSRKKGLANEGKAAAVFNEMDRVGNHDGKVSLKEWLGDPAVFQQKDENKDGFLTLEEFLPQPKKARR